MRLVDLVAGTRARQTVELDLGGENLVKVDLRKLSTLEQGLVLDRAHAFAIERKVDSPGPGDPIYDYATKIHTLAFALVAHESPHDAPVPFAESAEQIIASDVLSHDAIEFLFAAWELYVDQTSLQKRVVSLPEMIRLVSSLGGGETLPFIRLSPGMQLHLARFMAERLLSSRTTKSDSSSPSTPPSTTETKSDDAPGA